MKKVFIILVVVLGFAMSTHAQDVITLKNGDDIQAVVQEVGETEIKYKKYENVNGPTYTMRKSEIFMIRYANGSKDVFTNVSQPSVAPNTQGTIKLATPKPPSNPYKFRMYVGTGSGLSYGFVGASLEARFDGFGVHAGIGWFPDLDTPSWAVGTKWYFWKNLYVDTMVGVIGEQLEFGYNGGYYENHKAILGLTPMLGVNWSWGGNVRFGVNAGVGYYFGFDSELKGMAYDVGINISFGSK
jgi:hypothetical protein